MCRKKRKEIKRKGGEERERREREREREERGVRWVYLGTESGDRVRAHPIQQITGLCCVCETVFCICLCGTRKKWRRLQVLSFTTILIILLLTPTTPLSLTLTLTLTQTRLRPLLSLPLPHFLIALPLLLYHPFFSTPFGAVLRILFAAVQIIVQRRELRELGFKILS